MLMGQPRKPQVMVSHNWTNSFGSLAAAILADALGYKAYQDVAKQIATPEGIEQVRVKLGCKLDTTYWLCAFSVNQHASICAGFGPEPLQGTTAWNAWARKRYDSVTGEMFSLCDCAVQKVLSHTDPRCELNKFDDMMAYLAQEVACFTQLIVVDDDFDVLYRAWCLAEIFEASILGMPARIQVSSQETVDLNYDRLTLLDVRMCSASSQPDKDMIISKIADLDAFNWKIQELVFSADSGFFAEWVDGNERSRQVGRILRRCAMRSDSTVGEPGASLTGCCAMFHIWKSKDGNSDDESSQSELTAATTDSACSDSGF